MLRYFKKTETTNLVKLYKNGKVPTNTRIILMTTKSKKSYKEFLFKKNDTVLFGRESSGVPTSVHKKVSHRLTIPMMNKKRSLNLSSSVSIVVSKILNQINF